MIFKGIILTCLANFNMERSTSAVFHLLSGKKSIQTVHDAHLFKLGAFFHVYPELTKDIFNEIINENVSKKLLIRNGDSHIVTDKGNQWLSHYKNSIPYHYFNGLIYAQIDQIFYQRLLLLIQVLTNGKKQYYSYIPIIENNQITDWMKRFYPQIKKHMEKSSQQLHHELSQILHMFTAKEASIFVDRFTGYKHIGKSIQQLSESYQMSYDDVKLLLTGMTHNILNHVKHQQHKYPFISMIINDLEQKFITESAQKTLHMLEKYSIQQIAHIRNLKLNTIHDHIVEITLYDPNFPIHPYVSKDDQHEILKAAKNAGTTKLKTIKERLNEEISYFQIRITLAKYTVRN